MKNKLLTLYITYRAWRYCRTGNARQTIIMMNHYADLWQAVQWGQFTRRYMAYIGRIVEHQNKHGRFTAHEIDTATTRAIETPISLN